MLDIKHPIYANIEKKGKSTAFDCCVLGVYLELDSMLYFLSFNEKLARKEPVKLAKS